MHSFDLVILSRPETIVFICVQPDQSKKVCCLFIGIGIGITPAYPFALLSASR
jgi:hypothetical protein